MLRLCYLSAILIGVLTVAIGAVHAAALNSPSALCLKVGNQLLDVQAGQLASAPESIVAQQLGVTIIATAPSPTRRDTVLIYRQDQEHTGIALLANNRNWIDIQRNMRLQASIAWSPDGQYFSYSDNTTRAVLYDMQAHQATSIGGFWFGSWLFKGDYLALKALTPDATDKIWSAHDARFVASFAAPAAYLGGILPPANSVIYLARVPGNKEVVHLLRLDAQTDVELLHIDAFPADPALFAALGGSADGKYLSITLDNTSHIFTIDGHLVKTFSIDKNMRTVPFWVGNRLVISSANAKLFSLSTYDPASDQMLNLGSDLFFSSEEPLYTVRRDEIAFKQATSQSIRFTVVQTDGTHRVTSDSSYPDATQYAWLGNSIFIRDPSAPSSVTWMDTQTGHIHQLPKDPHDLNQNNLAFDSGKNAALIGASSTLAYPEFLYLLNMDASTLTTLLVASNSYQFAWSPDGAFAAVFSSSNGGVTVFDTAGHKRGFIASIGADPVWRSCGG